MPPPAYKPKPAAPAKQTVYVTAFYADPFDPRFRGADGEWTTLGTSAILYGELRRLLLKEAPDAVAFIDKELHE